MGEVIKKALQYGADFAEVFWEHKETATISCEDNKIERIIAGIDQGVGIRVIRGEQTSYAYTNEVELEKLLAVAELASKALKEKKSQEKTLSFITPKPQVELSIEQLPEQVKIETKVESVLETNKAARQVDPKIRQVTIGYGDIKQQIKIANSEGIFVEDQRIRTRLSVNAVAVDGDLIQTGFQSVGGMKGFELLNENNPRELGEKAAKRAILMLTAKPAPVGKMPVVLAAQAGGTMVHEACGHGLEADLVQKKLSVYAGKKGQEVSSPLVTVIDDGTIPGKFGTTRFDDEGYPTQKTVLINKGILENYMYDYQTARYDKKEPTGNGRRESYQNRPLPRMRNTYIAPGKMDPEKVIKEVQDGLLVMAMGGGQVNTTNGDYVFDVAEGYVLEDGDILYPVRGATLTGNGPETLKRVESVGKDLGYAIGICGKGGQGVPVSDAQPTMAISELIVGGTGTPRKKTPKIRRL